MCGNGDGLGYIQFLSYTCAIYVFLQYSCVKENVHSYWLLLSWWKDQRISLSLIDAEAPLVWQYTVCWTVCILGALENASPFVSKLLSNPWLICLVSMKIEKGILRIISEHLVFVPHPGTAITGIFRDLVVTCWKEKTLDLKGQQLVCCSKLDVLNFNTTPHWTTFTLAYCSVYVFYHLHCNLCILNDQNGNESWIHGLKKWILIWTEVFQNVIGVKWVSLYLNYINIK